jgi:hypothetical protein
LPETAQNLTGVRLENGAYNWDAQDETAAQVPFLLFK